MAAGRAYATLMVAVLALAGCMGAGDSADATNTPDPATQIRNGIEGTVSSDDLLPLEMAKVEILSLNLSAQTNSNGEYRFANLEPRDYLVVASKEGFRTLTQRAIVREDTIHQLDFTLDTRPIQAPYDEMVDRVGQISCKLVYGTDPESMQHRDCGEADAINNRPVHEFEIRPNGAQIVVEVFWQATTDASKHLTLTVESVGFGHQDLIFSSISGPTGIRVTLPQTIVEKYYPEGGVLRTRMDAGPSITGDEAGIDGGLAFQQSFTVYVTTFFIEPGPPSYSARPGQ